MDQTTLRRLVEDELAEEPSLNAAAIGVAAHEGVITLTGHVGSYADLHGAQRATLRVNGVRGVANELEVRLPDAYHRTDEDIAIDAANVLRSHAHVPENNVKVAVHGGRVLLEGEVDWWFQGETAANLIRNLIGVTSLENHIQVRRRAAPNGSIHGTVEAALRRTAIVDPSAVKVETRGDHVVLRGTVRAWWERDEAERIAWSVPGVCHVDNNLYVLQV